MDSSKSSNKYDLRPKKSKLKEVSSDSSDSDSSDEDYDYEYDDDEEDFDPVEFTNLLSKLFPSKYLSDKIKTGETKALSPSHKKRKHSQKEESDVSGDEEGEDDILGAGKQSINLIFQLDGNALYGDDYSDEEDDEWDSLEDAEESEEEEEEEKPKSKKKKKSAKSDRKSVV